ncbi:MAG: XdhC family protein, partial [Sedimenticola sp.]
MEQAKEWANSGLRLALATVVETWGSSPCPAGSQMVINSEAGFAGSVSGGCIETSVVSESLELLKEGRFEVADYGVSGEVSYAAGLACGGTIKVMMEPLDTVLLEALLGPRPAMRVVDLDTGNWALICNGRVEGELTLRDELYGTVAEAQSGERASIVETEGKRLFLQPLVPAYRLIIIGAVRISQALAPMAAEAGFDVTVIDPRRAFSTKERFPDIKLVREWPNEVLPDLGLDTHTAVVTLTHDAKPDDMALGLALRSDAFYVGEKKKKKTHAARV